MRGLAKRIAIGLSVIDVAVHFMLCYSSSKSIRRALTPAFDNIPGAREHKDQRACSLETCFSNFDTGIIDNAGFKKVGRFLLCPTRSLRFKG